MDVWFNLVQGSFLCSPRLSWFPCWLTVCRATSDSGEQGGHFAGKVTGDQSLIQGAPHTLWHRKPTEDDTGFTASGKAENKILRRLAVLEDWLKRLDSFGYEAASSSSFPECLPKSLHELPSIQLTEVIGFDRIIPPANPEAESCGRASAPGGVGVWGGERQRRRVQTTVMLIMIPPSSVQAKIMNLKCCQARRKLPAKPNNIWTFHLNRPVMLVETATDMNWKLNSLPLRVAGIVGSQAKIIVQLFTFAWHLCREGSYIEGWRITKAVVKVGTKWRYLKMLEFGGAWLPISIFISFWDLRS